MQLLWRLPRAFSSWIDSVLRVKQAVNCERTDQQDPLSCSHHHWTIELS